MTTKKKKAEEKRTISKLVYVACMLSLLSLVWTTYSVVDLLGTGPMGLTVAGSADLIWASVLYAQWNGQTHLGRLKVSTIGNIALLAVAGLLVWHGVEIKNIQVAVAGPILPLGTKLVWLLAITGSIDPSAMTPEMKEKLAQDERDERFKAQQAAATAARVQREHDEEMQRIERQGERVLKQTDVNFKIDSERERKRYELMQLRRELAQSAPLDTDLDVELDSLMLEPPKPPQGPGGLPLPEMTPPNPGVQEMQPPAQRQSIGAGSGERRVLSMQVGVTDLSEAQAKNKMIAAKWWLQGQHSGLTQNQFAANEKISGGQLTKILKKFPEDIILADNQSLGA